MSFSGFPDLGVQRRAEGVRVFAPMEGFAGSADFVCATALQIADRADGTPDFLLELRRGSSGSLYGALTFRVVPVYPDPQTLQQVTASPVRPLPFVRGFLRLWPQVTIPDLAGEALASLVAPVELSWNAAGFGAIRMLLRPETAEFVRVCLTGGALPLTAYVEAESEGIAPRCAVTADFDPKALLATIRTRLGGDVIELRALHDLLLLAVRNPGTLPLKLSGTIAAGDANRVAECLAYRLRVEYGAFEPVRAEDAMRSRATALSLRSRDEISSGRTLWDLSEKHVVPWATALTLDPLESVRRLVAVKGVEPFIRETTIPRLPFGAVRVWFFTNLPPLNPIESITVFLYAPPSPQRSQAIRKSIEVPVGDQEPQAYADLQFSSRETPTFTYRCVAKLKDGRRFDEPERTTTVTLVKGETEGFVSIAEDALPLRLVHVRAESTLLAQASLSVRIAWREDSTPFETTFPLAQGAQNARVVVIARNAIEPVMTVEATEVRGSRRIMLGPYPAETAQLGLHSFAEYSFHTITISADFDEDDDTESIVVSVRAEQSATVAQLKLTRDKPSARWSWLPKTLFASGYSYRLRREPSGEQDAQWSPPRSFNTHLHIAARPSSNASPRESRRSVC